MLCRQHLKQLLKQAQESGAEDRPAVLLRILHREAIKHCLKRVNHSTSKPRGREVLSVKVPVNIEGDKQFEEFFTEDEVCQKVSTYLLERFRLAFSAPAYKGKLFNDICFLGDNDVARQILEGTYVFPTDIDPATKLLFEEAAITFGKLSKEEVASYVTVDDFQYYWQRANERISSSYSGLHFGHYKAASFGRNLSVIHAAKLSECTQRGIPLARWGRGLTVLLEKIVEIIMCTS